MLEIVGLGLDLEAYVYDVLLGDLLNPDGVALCSRPSVLATALSWECPLFRMHAKIYGGNSGGREARALEFEPWI